MRAAAAAATVHAAAAGDGAGLADVFSARHIRHTVARTLQLLFSSQTSLTFSARSLASRAAISLHAAPHAAQPAVF